MDASNSKRYPGRVGLPQSLGDSIAQFVRSAGLGSRLMETRALVAWPKVVAAVAGDRAAEVAEADRVEARVLVVRVSEPVWRLHLRFHEHQLVALLNEKAEGSAITSIRFL